MYNKQTEDGIVTIKTQVDDLKVSSKTKRQIQHIINQLKEIYRELTVHEEDTHDYLGMIMEHDRDAGSVKINMRTYIENTIVGFHEEEPNEKLKDVTTLVTNNLFKTRDGEVEKLSKQRAKVFQSTIARLLFVAKRARPDILLALSFLTT